MVVGCVAAVHLVACIGLLLIADATELNPDMESRARWVRTHVGIWTVTWVLWSVSSISLLALFLVWTTEMRRAAPYRRFAWIGCATVAIGLAFDLAGETVLITRATAADLSVQQFADVVRLYGLLGPGVANGLYCVGGLMVSTVAWRGGWLRGPVGFLGFVMWSVGMGLTFAAFADHDRAMVVTGGGVMLLFIPWAAALAWKLREIHPQPTERSTA